MTQQSGYFQYYNSSDRISKVAGADVSNYQYPINWNTMWNAGGRFVYQKCGGVTFNYITARYIKVTVQGSTSNARGIFNEIQVMDSSWTNLALNKTVTASQTPIAGYPLSNVVNDNFTDYTILDIGTQWVQIDLGSVYTNIYFLIIQLYYLDGRTFHNKKVEYSSDGVTYTELYNSDNTGEYPEKYGGQYLIKNNSYAKNSAFTISNLTAARNAGFKVGFYWFKNPVYWDSTTGGKMTVTDAETEATNFYNYIVSVTGSGSDMGDLMPMLDFENNTGNIYPACYNDDAYNFIEAFKNKFKTLSGGRQVILYTAYYTIQNLAANPLTHSTKGGVGQLMPLWLAATDKNVYPGTSGDYTAFGSFYNNKWYIWQFSSDGNHQGASWGVSSTDIDLDILETDLYSIMPPSIPQNFYGVVGDNSVTLHWNLIPDTAITGYDIYKNDLYYTSVNALTTLKTITGLTNGTSYTFKIKATDVWEESNFTNTITLIPKDISKANSVPWNAPYSWGRSRY